METLAKITDKILQEAKVGNPSQTQLQKSLQTSLPESFSESDKSLVVTQLGACLAVQRTYGKQASDLGAVAKIFLSDLKEHSADDIARALTAWRKKSPEFPTPADIENLLDPEPVYDKSVYLALLKRKEKGSLSEFSKEYQYIKDYENHIINGG